MTPKKSKGEKEKKPKKTTGKVKPLPTRKKPSEARKELIESDMPLAVFVGFDVEEIKLKKKHWYLKMWVDKILDKSYYNYRMTMQFNEQPYEDEIYEMENEIRDSLFAEEKSTRTQLNKRIKEKRQKMEALKNECESIEFIAYVEEVKYKDRGTMILCRVPDDVIQPMNRQKSRFSYYEVKLDPIYG